MLREICISNLILIDELRVELEEGLNVFTGETGAGKSILVDALGFLTGDRVSGDLVRDTARKAVIEAVFSIESDALRRYLIENGFIDGSADEDLLVVRREISEGGRSTARINSRTVTLGRLKALGELLVDIHLQHDNQLLLNPGMYGHFLDSFDPGTKPLVEEIRSIYDSWEDKNRELEELVEGEKDRARELDFLQFQIAEIEALNLVGGEDEELAQRLERLRNVEELREGAEEIYRFVYGAEQFQSAYDLVAAAVEKTGLLKKEGFFADLLPALETCLYTLEEIKDRLAGFRKELEFDPHELEEVEGRLEAINRLKRKYGGSIEATLEFLEQARREKERLATSEVRIEELQKEVERLRQEYYQRAGLLSERRKTAGDRLQRRVHSELLQLGMPGVTLQVSITPREVPGRDGLDQVMFLFSANPGEEARPLSRVASGGEVSRLVLALKAALAEVYEVPTLVFDEVDVGVGGSALNAVAQKLWELSQHHQVVLVTHSPQVASYADGHYLLEKTVEEGVTITRARRLDGQERVEEIARMLSGDSRSQVSLEHARQILDLAASRKEKHVKADRKPS